MFAGVIVRAEGLLMIHSIHIKEKSGWDCAECDTAKI